MSIQNKILLGIGSFVGIMLLVGWVAINEPARMEVFTEQWAGRSIERGAELYLNNCTTCHAVDSLGLANYAPALKNPYLFLDKNPAKVANDELRDLNAQRTALQRALDEYRANVERRATLQREVEGLPEGSEERKAKQAELDDLDARIRVFDPQTEQKIAALDPQIAEAQAKLEALVAQGWDPNRDVRLAELKWPGGLADYLRSTLISGRPTTGGLWGGNIMPAWGQAAGGPLRQDEIENLVNYLMNYREEAIKLTPNDIRQNFKIPGEATVVDANKEVIGPGADIKALDLTGGDPAAGQQAYQTYACAGCHSQQGGAAYSFAPTAGTYTRVVNVRLKTPEHEGFTAAQYLAESILYPSRYIVPGGAGVQMPQNYAEQLSLKELQDLIAFLETQK